MLYHIIEPRYFLKCLEAVKKAYWPYEHSEFHQAIGLINNLRYDEKKIAKEKARKDWNLQDIWLNQLKEDIVTKKILQEGSRQPLYRAFKDEGNAEDRAIPFLIHFHQLFSVRRWNEPYKNPSNYCEELFRLKKGEKGNYSQSYGNYYHFVNVVAALARLIMYFHDKESIRGLVQDRSRDYNALAYGQHPGTRTFKLMLAGFYHDVGKAVVDPRHAMEGAVVLVHHTTKGRHQLYQIAKIYNPSEEFERDDLLFVADLVRYHDHFGTVGTGEDSYLPLVDAIDRFKRYSLKHDTDKTIQLEWAEKYLFDLWLLNVADIMVSLERKFEEQKEWLADKEASDKINQFLHSSQGGSLIHDLKITFQLVREHGARKHFDDLSYLEHTAHEYSKRHAIERLRRLVTSTCKGPLAKWTRQDDAPIGGGIAKQIENLSEEYWNSAIVRSIQGGANASEFIRRFSWIGRMDYALGFFAKIVEAAFTRVNEELSGGERTGWLRRKEANDPPEMTVDYLDRAQAQLFADNYVATVIQILGYLLFRDPSIDSIRNIEFNDATRRLTEDKIRQLLSLEGPARSRKSIQAVLQTIYLY